MDGITNLGGDLPSKDMTDVWQVHLQTMFIFIHRLFHPREHPRLVQFLNSYTTSAKLSKRLPGSLSPIGRRIGKCVSFTSFRKRGEMGTNYRDIEGYPQVASHSSQMAIKQLQ